MSSSQILLNAVLFAMIFSVALELKPADFIRVAKRPLPVVAGLVAQFMLLPVATFIATMILDLPANIEAGMLLVAACPCGSLSNFVTHYSRGNTALSVSITAVANVIALLMTPTNFAWMVASNPNTAVWLKEIDVDPGMIWINLAVILALPLALGLLTRRYFPNFSDKAMRPMGRFAVAALFAFVIVALIRDRHMFLLGIGGLFVIVVLHNASGLLIGYLSGTLARLPAADRKALTFETGMQNAGLALGIIGTQFDADIGMVLVAGMWGTWHIVSGFSLAHFWRTRTVECLTQE